MKFRQGNLSLRRRDSSTGSSGAAPDGRAQYWLLWTRMSVLLFIKGNVCKDSAIVYKILASIRLCRSIIYFILSFKTLPLSVAPYLIGDQELTLFLHYGLTMCTMDRKALPKSGLGFFIYTYLSPYSFLSEGPFPKVYRHVPSVCLHFLLSPCLPPTQVPLNLPASFLDIYLQRVDHMFLTFHLSLFFLPSFPSLSFFFLKGV